jgi:hypothetical protein
VDLMLDCWLEVSCIQKVLRPANLIKVFRGFPWSQSKCWVGTQIPRCTACFPCALPMVILEILYCTRDFEILGPDPPGWWSLRWDSKIRPWVLRDFDLRVTALARPRQNCMESQLRQQNKAVSSAGLLWQGPEAIMQ